MDPDATLNELEGPGWADPDYPSTMVQRIRALGQIPLREFTAEDYRLIITQQRALATLVPLALELLESEPFAEGDLYAICWRQSPTSDRGSGKLNPIFAHGPNERWQSRFPV